MLTYTAILPQQPPKELASKSGAANDVKSLTYLRFD